MVEEKELLHTLQMFAPIYNKIMSQKQNIDTNQVRSRNHQSLTTLPRNPCLMLRGPLQL